MGFLSIKKLTGGIFSGAPTPEPAEIATGADLKVEEEEKRTARQRALASLNPTGALGAGTPETTRRQTLGV